ncbi:hypothetical protein D9758_016099 [Tetrapyrgos nigripes]|uniref:Uncharacterized protein n=1 Tax=Tetrapyrgos nigripes TaxID=182062 RepID=A0A8H5FN44_9AGAR|nr:hypothetical protein D9758_016099 [Tetrapyrgos nigripes]
MSDKYGRVGFNKDNLTDDSANENLTLDERTKNYPSEGDTTSSGGYSATSNVWTDKAQRGNLAFALERDPNSQPNSQFNSRYASRNGSQTMIDQSLSGSDLSGQLRIAVAKAKLGRDGGKEREEERERMEDLGPGA